jgi:hypothetical protein
MQTKNYFLMLEVKLNNKYITSCRFDNMNDALQAGAMIGTGKLSFVDVPTGEVVELDDTGFVETPSFLDDKYTSADYDMQYEELKHRGEVLELDDQGFIE